MKNTPGIELWQVTKHGIKVIKRLIIILKQAIFMVLLKIMMPVNLTILCYLTLS